MNIISRQYYKVNIFSQKRMNVILREKGTKKLFDSRTGQCYYVRQESRHARNKIDRTCTARLIGKYQAVCRKE
jgi:hypothetical protein